MRIDTRLLSLLLAVASPAVAATSDPQHHIFFNRDRERIHEASFWNTPAIAGAQLK